MALANFRMLVHELLNEDPDMVPKEAPFNYADLNDAPVTDHLRQANINTKNQLMDFSDSSWQDYPYTGRSTGEYIIFYQGGPIDHVTHIPGPVAQYSEENEYNAACTAGMPLAHSMN